MKAVVIYQKTGEKVELEGAATTGHDNGIMDLVAEEFMNPTKPEVETLTFTAQNGDTFQTGPKIHPDPDEALDLSYKFIESHPDALTASVN